MKQFLIPILIFLVGCSTKIDTRILGEWNVQSQFYRATFKIEKVSKKVIGKVLYYNDDTTILKETGTDKDIFLHNLTYKNDAFVDAIAGATITKNERISITVKHQDTLEFTQYILHKPVVEIWTRKQ